ncbi:hypothetical protein PC116_g16717 [Phytophthora cactorum]|uniref:HAT C-terminal dimerisation domain-containing protein n=1 Tax=Phytophthora cactorum TaxID=29920 RepID=A0A8T1KER8_9STRA|nr:hypothetical protein PC113_g5072 [Phytophthora cactorum]KAG2899614.1 hypothetical protein PC114_g13861 [Phytophthora cactorum]KAG2931060.1 hypothetical protein PC117_g13568 [Phytophthora cactorum]KAG3125672.1 hypothetical protein C6341_g25685 [Phytophthora cactorum]KAG4235143.1 hypothetical protein PC116_g16717 [Phytophthora cactorum]
MFLAAVARPRYDPYKKTKFNGKIGIWPFTEESVAQRSRANRPKGSLVTKNIESIDSHVYKDYIINKVIPAIKKVWPRVTTAGTDRSFSTMKRIKTRLRTSMGDAWMSNLMIIAIERGLTNQIDKNEVIDAFSSMTKRRIPM